MHTDESARGKATGSSAHQADGLNSAAGLPRSPLVILIDPARLTRESLGHLLHEKAPDLRIETLSDCSETMAHQPEVPAIVLVNAKMAEIADPGSTTPSAAAISAELVTSLASAPTLQRAFSAERKLPMP